MPLLLNACLHMQLYHSVLREKGRRENARLCKNMFKNTRVG